MRCASIWTNISSRFGARIPPPTAERLRPTHHSAEILRERIVYDDLRDKVALITGAAHGQGRACAIALAREGVHIAALDVARHLASPDYPRGTAHELDSIAAEIRSLSVPAIAVVADVRDGRAVAAAVG